MWFDLVNSGEGPFTKNGDFDGQRCYFRCQRWSMSPGCFIVAVVRRIQYRGAEPDGAHKFFGPIFFFSLFLSLFITSPKLSFLYSIKEGVSYD